MDNLCPHTDVHCKALDMCRRVGKPQLLTRDDGAAGVSVLLQCTAVNDLDK